MRLPMPPGLIEIASDLQASGAVICSHMWQRIRANPNTNIIFVPMTVATIYVDSGRREPHGHPSWYDGLELGETGAEVRPGVEGVSFDLG